MFKRILVPISSEQELPLQALRRACRISQKVGAEVVVHYIIERKLFSVMEGIAEHTLTHQELHRLEKTIREEKIRSVRGRVFDEVDRFCSGYDITSSNLVSVGRFSDEILKTVEEEGADLVVLEFVQSYLLAFRIFEKSPVPVWVEGERKDRKDILGVLSNRAPNKRVPDMLVELARAFGAKVHLLYVVSPYDPGKSLSFKGCSAEERQEAEEAMLRFDEACGPSIKVIEQELVEGSIVNTVLKKCKEIDPFLIVMGRIEERDIMLGLKRGVKKRLAEKTTHNLFLVK